MKIRNTFIIFLVSGFWHGANWTFIFWGALNAFYILPSILFNTNRNNLNSVASGNCFPTIKEVVSMLLTFGLTVLAWIFFRANSLNQAFFIIERIANKSLFTTPTLFPKLLILVLFVFIIIEWFGREKQYPIEKIDKHMPLLLRWFIYLITIFAIAYFYQKEQQFIYFQF